MNTILRTTALGALMLALTLPVANAQSFRYESTTAFKMGGAAGAIAGLMKLDKISEVVSLQDDRLHTARGKDATILDLPGERMITISKKDCRIVTFEQLRQQHEELRQKMAKSQANREETASEPGTEVSFDFDLEHTGSGTAQGYSVEKYTMTMSAISEEGETKGSKLVMVSDLAMTKEVKGYEVVQEFHMRWAKALGEVYLGKETMENLQATILGNPKVQDMMKKAQEEQMDLEGVTVEQTSYIVVVPAGVEYDAALVRVVKEEKKSTLGGLMKMATNTGGGQDSATQQTLFTTAHTMRNFSTEAIDPGLFIPPGKCK